MTIDESLAVYSSADSRYVAASVVALTSVRRFHPACSLFLMADGTRLSSELRNLLREFEIELVDMNLSSAFSPVMPGPWPSEAFWQLAGPKEFAARGFRHSLYVDGDVLVAGALPLQSLLPEVRFFAGIDDGPAWWQLGDPARLKAVFGIEPARLTLPATNTGVLLYNNASLAEVRLFEEAVRVFAEGQPWAFQHQGDQTLLALTALILRVPMLVLGPEWNFRFDWAYHGHNAGLRRRVERDPLLGRNSLYAIHFLGGKPWARYPSWRKAGRAMNEARVAASDPSSPSPPRPWGDPWTSSARARVHWVNEWRAFARRLLGEERVRRYFGQEATAPVRPTLSGRACLSVRDVSRWLGMVRCQARGAPPGVPRSSVAR